MTDKTPEGPISSDPITRMANEAANKFVSETEHVALNADEEDAETIIRNMRFMAYGIGWEDGYRAALAESEERERKAFEAGMAILALGWEDIAESLDGLDEAHAEAAWLAWRDYQAQKQQTQGKI